MKFETIKWLSEVTPQLKFKPQSELELLTLCCTARPLSPTSLVISAWKLKQKAASNVHMGQLGQQSAMSINFRVINTFQLGKFVNKSQLVYHLENNYQKALRSNMLLLCVLCVSYLVFELGKVFHLHYGALHLYQPQSQRIKSH